MSIEAHLTRIQRIKKNLPSWTEDLTRLQRLVEVDEGASLHKLRTLSERLVHEVAARHHQDPSTRADRLGETGHLPPDIVAHLQTVEERAALGDHFRKDAPGPRQLEEALDAFVVALEWYRSSRLGDAEATTLKVGDPVQDYVVEAVLGVGGMATVYQVRHRTLGSMRALKLLDVPGKMVRERLVREGQIQARLQHPNVVTVLDVVSHEGRSGLVMEYVQGVDLDTLITDSGVPREQLDAVIEGILAGVAAAHASGVVHRDLKPSNIMVVRGSPWVAKVADFGIAKVTEPPGGAGLTKTGHIFGTPRYMSPEQFEDTSNVDARGDVWAIGCILYELATGHIAFDGPDPLAIWERVSALDYVPVRQLAPGVPGRLAEIIERCITLDRDGRPNDAGEVLALWSTHVSAAPTVDAVRPVPRRAPGVSSLAPTVLHSNALAEPTEPDPGAAPTAPPSRRTLVAFALVVGLLLAVVAVAALGVSAVGLAWFTHTPS